MMCTLHVNVDAKLGDGILTTATKVEIYEVGVSYITLWFFI